MSIPKNSKGWMWFVISMLGAGTVLFLSEKFIQGNDPLKITVQGVIATLAVTLSLTALTSARQFSEIVEAITRSLGTSRNAIDVGLEEVHLNWSFVDFRKLILESRREIVAHGIYLQRWLDNHTDELKKFAEQKGSSLKVVTIATGSPGVPALEEKFSAVPNSQSAKERISIAGKIQGTTTSIRVIGGASTTKGRVQLFHQDFVPTYSLYKFDDTIVIVPYKQCPGRSNEIPAFVSTKTSPSKDLFSFFENDIQELLKDYATVAYENKNK